MWRKRSLSIVAAALCALILTTGASAKTIYVDDNASAGDGTSWATAYRFLQDGLARAVDGDEVRVGQGLYKPDQNSENPVGTRDRSTSFKVAAGIHLRGGFAGFGADDPNEWDTSAYPCILSGDLNGDDDPVADPCDLLDAPSRLDNAYHVVHLMGGILEGMDITGGYAYRYLAIGPYNRFISDHGGGGVWGDGTIRGCLIRENYGEEAGGGLWCAGEYDQSEEDRPHISVYQCRFIGNASRDWGGGICLMYSDADMSDSKFKGNWAGLYGGGGDFHYSDGNLMNCSFIQNETAGSGGGISTRGGAYSYCMSEFLACYFASNRARHTGGGASSAYSKCSFTACELTENGSDTRGGAIGGEISTFALKNTLVHKNSASDYGGAMHIRQYASLECQNCTIVNNIAPEGSFLAAGTNSPYGTSETVILSNCIIRNEGQELWNYDAEIQIDHTNLAVQRDLWYDPCDAIVLGEGYIEADPCFAEPGHWDNNSTPDDPHDDFFVEGDYHLKSQAGRWDPASGSWVQDDVTSPCIDAGDPNTPIMYEPFPNGGIVNTGAYGGTAEASKSYFGGPVCETIIAGDINGDCKVDIADLILLIDHWTEP